MQKTDQPPDAKKTAENDSNAPFDLRGQLYRVSGIDFRLMDWMH